MIDIETVEKALALYSERLDISEDSDSIYIKPKTYIPRPVFMNINGIIFRYHGTYKPSGKNSFWKISKSSKPQGAVIITNTMEKPKQSRNVTRCPHCGKKIKVEKYV